MSSATNSPLCIAIASAAHLLNGTPHDYDPLLKLIGEARFVLLGESTHGTQEFYEERTRITERLITEKDFTAVAWEADWPDACRLNKYVLGINNDPDSERALSGFSCFPAWIWRNTAVRDFAGWLRNYNDRQTSSARKVGFYGLDLYSMYTSIAEALRYIEEIDPEAAHRARQRHDCSEDFGQDIRHHPRPSDLGLPQAYEEQVIAWLSDLRSRASRYQNSRAQLAADEFFHAQQSMRLAANAEHYYRSVLHGGIESRNMRDRHMAETLEGLARHLSRPEQPAKIVAWGHNLHVGDARATAGGRQGRRTLGQLVRECWEDDAVLIGFTTYQGTVMAASDWDGMAECKQVEPALPGSYEETFHQTGLGHFMLPLAEENPASKALAAERLERAIGMIYRPRTERQNHYFKACLSRQFDAIVHLDETHALQPLDQGAGRSPGSGAESYPSGS